MIQRRPAAPPSSRQGQAQAASGGQRWHGRDNPPASSRPSAAAIAMQPFVQPFETEAVAAALRQRASLPDGASMDMAPMAQAYASMSANAPSRISHRAQSIRQHSFAGVFGRPRQAAQASRMTLAASRPTATSASALAAPRPAGPDAAETAFEAVPLAYASAQTGAAAASAGPNPPVALASDAAAAPTLELRRQPAPPPATPAPEAPASPSAVKAAIDLEQLQQAISKLPMLNPDQIADQVYKAIARRMKFEQRLQGY